MINVRSECGEPINGAVRADALHCSSRCRQRAYRLRPKRLAMARAFAAGHPWAQFDMFSAVAVTDNHSDSRNER